MTFTPERWYQHQLMLLSKQLAEASQELRVLRGEKVARELEPPHEPCWLCKLTLPKVRK